jgi:hypothetical protein
VFLPTLANSLSARAAKALRIHPHSPYCRHVVPFLPFYRLEIGCEKGIESDPLAKEGIEMVRKAWNSYIVIVMAMSLLALAAISAAETYELKGRSGAL